MYVYVCVRDLSAEQSAARIGQSETTPARLTQGQLRLKSFNRNFWVGLFQRPLNLPRSLHTLTYYKNYKTSAKFSEGTEAVEKATGAQLCELGLHGTVYELGKKVITL